MSKTPATPEKQQSQGVHSIQDAILAARGIRWSYLLIAFCLSVALWYTVTVRDKVESWVDLQVVFRSAPENLVISDGLINKLSVRVRAARGLSSSIIGREGTVVVNLSSITRGSNAIAITRDMIPLSPAYEVMEISPSRIQIVADVKASREIELETGFNGKLGPDLFVKSIKISPPSVTVSGAESLVTNVTRVQLPVPLGPDVPKGLSSMTVAVPVPSNVTVSPPQVTVDMEVDIRTRQLKLTRNVIVDMETGGEPLETEPAKVAIVADIPESITKNSEQLAQITARVLVPQQLELGKRALPVTVDLPANATLVSVTPPEVAVVAPRAAEPAK